MNLQHVPNITAATMANAIEDCIDKYELISQHKFFADGEDLVREYLWAIYYISYIGVQHAQAKLKAYWFSKGRALVENGVPVEDVIPDIKLMKNIMDGKHVFN